MEKMFARLREKHSEIVDDSDDFIDDFSDFLKARKMGNIPVSGDLQAAYAAFVQANDMPGDQRNILQANPSLLLLLRGMEHFVEKAASKVDKKHDRFIQNLSGCFMEPELAARPAAEIYHMRFGELTQDIRAVYEFEPFDRLETGKEYEAHLGANRFYFHSRLSAAIRTDPENPREIVLKLSYAGELPEEKFLKPVSAFFQDDEITNYHFLWLMKTAKWPDGMSIDFPHHDFSYPQNVVDEPYKYAWRYLKPYPSPLDMLFDLHNIPMEIFEKNSDRQWKADICIQLSDDLPGNKTEHLNSGFHINALPVFYWHETRVRKRTSGKEKQVYEDPDRLIRLIGPDGAVWPVYIHDSGKGRSADMAGNSILIQPIFPGKNPGSEPLIENMRVLVAGEPDAGTNLLPGDRAMDKADRKHLQLERRVRSDSRSMKYQSRAKASPEKKDFWNTLSRIFRQPQDDEFMKDHLGTYLKERMEGLPIQPTKEWLTIESGERSVMVSQKQKKIPCIRLFVIIDTDRLDTGHRAAVQGILWRATGRFYNYLDERLPPNTGLFIGLYRDSKEGELYVWRQ